MIDIADFFVAGGTLRPLALSYVVRPADRELLACIKAGEFCYVLTSRQMGKSSLMVQTAYHLQHAQYVTVVLDLTSIGTGSAEEWYQGLLERIKRDLRLTVDVRSWWQEHSVVGIPQRFIEFLHDVVLQEIFDPVVIFIDEIDAMFNLDFRDDFFAAIRAIYNARAVNLVYHRLTFVLLGVATPTDLIRDPKRTPFNIGRRIVLQEIDYADAAMLRDGLERYHPGQGEVILERIFYWTSGHPYLTQKLCLATIEQPVKEWNTARVDELVETTFLLEEGRNDTNIKSVQKSIQDSTETERRRMLKLYEQVYNGKSVLEDYRSRSQNYLELYGLIRTAYGVLKVRNEIYRHIFNKTWIKNNFPINMDRILAVISLVLGIISLTFVFFQYTSGTPAERRAQECEQTFNNTRSSTERLTALVCLFDLNAPQYDERALQLFYNLSLTDQHYFFFDPPQAQERSLTTVIEKIFRTLPDTPKSEPGGSDHDDEILDGMIKRLKSVPQTSTSDLKKQIEALRSGRRRAAAGDYASAIDYYNQVLNSQPDHPAALYDRAMAYMALGQYAETLTDLDHMVEIAINTPVPTVTPTPSVTRSPSTVATSTSATGTTPRPTATPTVATTATLTTTSNIESNAPFEYKRFLNPEEIRRTVVEAINTNPPLQRYLQETLAQETYPHLVAMSDRLRIALVNTPTRSDVQSTGTPSVALVTSIAPTNIFTGTLPITFIVRGENLNAVQMARLVALGRKPIQFTIGESDAPDELILVLVTLPEPLNGEVTYKLQLNGKEYTEIKLRDYSENKDVKGVKSEYEYTGRVADDNGPFTSMRAVRDVDSERTGVLRNGDEIAILRDERDGWYLVRIVESNDPEQIGKVGWIERWLVDDKADEVPTPVPTLPPPPTFIPRPLPTSFAQPSERYFSAGSIVSYDGTGDSGRFESCVTGSVSGSEGPIIGATVNVNDGPVNSYTATTGGGGYFRVCGLGASNWTAVLYYVPGVPTGNQPAVTVYVNGLPEQQAVVSFTQQ